MWSTLPLWLPIALLLGYTIVVFNQLVRARNACANAKSGIDVGLTRRHDLIPNLVKAVKGYMQHERATLVAVTDARNAAAEAVGTAESAPAEANLDVELTRLIARSEDYPELGADRLFIKLMKNLTEAEEQIAAARRSFNAQVMAMNNLVQSFPTSIVAKMMGFVALAYYRAGDDQRSAPSARLLEAGAAEPK